MKNQELWEEFQKQAAEKIHIDVTMAEYVKWLERKVMRARSIGTVFIYPSDWNSFKEGRRAGIDDYEPIDLSQL